jgi:glutathione S-transferase/alpha,alpha-trehalase
MSGTQLDKPNRALDVLESMLGKDNKEWLVNNQFSVADVAVGSYLNYVPIFFSGVNPTNRPNIVKYMARCAARPKFGEAFGADHQNKVLSKAELWIKSAGNGSGFKLW